MGRYCPRCGEPNEKHKTDDHGRTVCADQTLEHEARNLTHHHDDISVFRGERVGRRRGDY